MKYTISLMTFVSILLFSCTGNGQNKGLLSPSEFDSKLNSESVQLVDVRTPQEYAKEHLKGALHINIMDSGFENRVSELDKNKPIMVYCAAGGRSANAAKKLKSMGFENVYDLKGGINAWKSAKLPIVID